MVKPLLQVYFPEELMDEVREVAKKQDRSIASLGRIAVREYLNNYKRENQ